MRLAQVQHGSVSGGTFNVNPTGTSTYSYDAYGNLSTVGFQGNDPNAPHNFAYTYTYTATGHVTGQTMTLGLWFAKT